MTNRKVSSHRLCHTHATQLLNVGCRVTTIQKLLGHQWLNSTMIYGHIHDRTVADDYYAVMEVVEKRLEAIPPEKEEDADPPVNDDELTQRLELATQVAEPELDVETRLDLVEQMCEVLNHRTPKDEKQPVENENGRRLRALLGYSLGASPAFSWGRKGLTQDLPPVKKPRQFDAQVCVGPPGTPKTQSTKNHHSMPPGGQRSKDLPDSGLSIPPRRLCSSLVIWLKRSRWAVSLSLIRRSKSA